MNDYQLTLSDYLAIAQRRAWLIAGTFAAAMAVGVAVSLLVPPVYRSAGTLLIESQQIATDSAQPGGSSADERIEVIKQRVMTRENLLRVIERHGLFADAGPGFTPSERVDVMRKTIAVEQVQANLNPDRPGPGTISFSIAFEHRRPEIAQAVANDLVNLFIEENVKLRTQRAAQTTEFLTQEADKLKKEVDAIEAQVAKYKQEHASALPENVTLGMAAMQRVEADLRQVERDHASAEDALRALEAERGAALAALAEPPAGAAGTADTTQGELQRARMDLARLAATYTESHPDVKAARRKVEGLERAASVEAAAAPATAPRRSAAVSAAAGRFDARANGLRERARVLAGQRAALREKLAQMDVSLVRSPQVERGLLTLTRDYQSAQKKYEEVLGRKMSAQMAENLEGGQKAERFTVLDAPTLPDNPIKPNRKKLLAMSFILAVVAAAGAVALLEALRGTVRGIGQIRAIWGQEPLVAIPVIPVPGEGVQQRKRMLAVTGGALLVGCVVLGLVHFLFVPLDLLVMKAITRMG